MMRTFDLQNNDKGYLVDLMNDAIAMIEATDESDGPEDIDIALESLLEVLLLRYMSGRFIAMQAEPIKPIAGPVEKSSFKITPGDAAVLETMAKKLAQESKAFLEDIEEEDEFLNSTTEALFLFLRNRMK